MKKQFLKSTRSIFIKILLVSFCTVSPISYSQVVKGKIISSQNSPIAWASLVYSNNSKGTYSNELGFFSIDFSVKDTIFIHALGYQDKKIPLKSLKINSENIITLTEKPIEIEEVTVNFNKRKVKNYRIGFFEHPDNQYTKGNWGLRPGTSAFVYLKNNNPELNCILAKILINLEPNIYDQSRSRIRLRICKVTDDKQPGDDLLLNNVLIDTRRLQNTIKVDVTNYNITLPKNGIFIGIEYIGWLKGNRDVNTSWTFATRRYIYLKGVVNKSFKDIGASYKWTERTAAVKVPHWFSITDGEVKEWEGHSYAIGVDLAVLGNSLNK